ncbi:MAG: DMT family transporter [Reyranellaceae bacterium]
MRMQGSDFGLLAVLGLLWGGSFVFTSIAVHELPPLTLATARYGLSALVLLGWMAMRGIGVRLTLGLCLSFVVMGALNNLLPFGLIAFGQLHVPAGLAAILNSTAPLFGAVLTPLLAAGEERFSVFRFLGVFLGIAGIAVLSLPALAGAADFAAWALLPGLGAALSYAFAAIWGLRFRGLPVLVIASGQLVAATLLGLPLAALVDHAWLLRPSMEALAAVGALALFCTALGYLIYTRLLVRSGPTNALLVTFLVPPAAVAIDLLAFGQRLPDMALPALALIFAGIACVDGRAPLWLRGRLAAASSR